MTAYGRLAINGYSPQLGNKMSNADEQSAGELLWQQARDDYENTEKRLDLVAEVLGITKFKLVIEARRRGWKLRNHKKNSNGTRATILRFKELLQKRLGELENQIGQIGEEVSSATSERDIRAVNMLVRTLEKVLELERKDRAHRARKIKERRKFDDADRDELARRLTALHHERRAMLPEPVPDDAGSSGSAEGLALLGTAQSADST